jgi:ATP-dependent Lon protease
MNANDTPAAPEHETPAPAPSLPEDMLIILPVRNLVMFPGVILPVAMKRPKTVAGAQEAVRTEAKVGFLLQRDPTVDDPGEGDLYRVGTVAAIHRYVTAPDGSRHVVVGVSDHSSFGAADAMAEPCVSEIVAVTSACRAPSLPSVIHSSRSRVSRAWSSMLGVTASTYAANGYHLSVVARISSGSGL